MKATIICIGDELLIGQVTDTNSGSLARIMEPMGWSVERVIAVHDDAGAIRQAMDEALGLTDVVITTGGLGPTKDDITKQVMLEYFGGEMRMDPEVTANIEDVFRKRGLQLNELTRQQALVPSSCTVIQNRVGTAPIMWFERDGKVLVAMPGVPFEAIQMFTTEVFPRLCEKFPSATAVRHRTFVISGISESDLAIRLSDWEDTLPVFTHLAYLPDAGIIRLRIDGVHSDAKLLDATLDRLSEELKESLGNLILADADLTIPEIVINLVREKGLKLAIAESCTGGAIASSITAIAGCSDVYVGGVVSYANDVKIRILGVEPATIDRLGVVSEPVVEQMAEGVKAALCADCAVATSGIAGPGGATPGKPVGTVCIAASVAGKTETRTCRFPGTRDRVIRRATHTALVMLAQLLREV